MQNNTLLIKFCKKTKFTLEAMFKVIPGNPTTQFTTILKTFKEELIFKKQTSCVC